jgi:predicted TPR repeat methyltransferase
LLDNSIAREGLLMSQLALNPSLLLTTSTDGYLIYDVDCNRLHRLNPTAALIVELCDGTRTREQVLATVEPLLAANGADSCTAWLDQAMAQNLLQSSVQASARAPWTASELHNLATQLRQQDRVLAAFICQQRATELAPDDLQQWYALAESSHIVGRRDEARAAYERCHRAHPEDVEVEHMLIALRDEPPPARASDQYIERLYSRFAEFYDDNMCGELDFRAPDLLNQALGAALAARDELSVLELGCGTGLFGKLVRPRARHLVGIDLSAAMVERASQRGVYDELETAEITAWLARQQLRSHDAIAACDTLIYFGDLRQILRSAAGHLAPGGILAFTVEQGDTFPFRLSDSGRFAHHRDHLLEAAQEANLPVISLSKEVLRYEYGEPVVGFVAVLGCSNRADGHTQDASARC